MSVSGQQSTAMSRRGFRWRALLGLVVGVLLCVAAVPVLLLEQTVTQTRVCFEQIEQRAQPQLPRCDQVGARLATLSRLPTSSRAARRLAAELQQRWARAAYLDAAVGHPDAVARGQRYPALRQEPTELLEQEPELRLDQLGPPLAVAEPGAWAQWTGDFANLLASDNRHHHHDVAMAALRAALLSGDSKRALALAQQSLDSPDEELRVSSAALLCIFGETDRALAALVAVEHARADRRHANFWKHFGDVRVVIEACAGLADRPPPRLPSYGYAGSFDQGARVVVLRLRKLASGCPGGQLQPACREQPAVLAALSLASELLTDGSEQPHRLALLASVAPSIEQPDRLLSLAQHKANESTRFVGGVALEDWLPDDVVPRDDEVEPFVAALDYERAAAHALSLAAQESKLDALARRWLLHAAVAHARAGRQAEAQQRARAATQTAQPSEQRQFRATVAMLGGDLPAARRALAAPPQGSAAHRLSYLLQRAQLRLPNVGAASADLTAAQALLAELSEAERQRHELRLMWLRAAATGNGPDVLPPRRPAGPTPAHVPMPPQLARELELARLAQWLRWAQQPEPRVAARYSAWRVRAVPASFPSAFYWLAGKLVDDPGGREVWLDALGSHALRAMPLRRYAFARARAAAWRADQPAEQIWWQRYRQLQQWAHHERFAELYLALGL